MRLRSLALPVLVAVSLIASLAPASAAPSNLSTAKKVAAELNVFIANEDKDFDQVLTYVRSTSSTQAAKEIILPGSGGGVVGWQVGTTSTACVLPPVLSDRFTAVSGTCQAWYAKNNAKIKKESALTVADQIMKASFRAAEAEAAFTGGKVTIALVLEGMKGMDTSLYKVSSTKSTITLKHPWATATYRISGGKIRR